MLADETQHVFIFGASNVTLSFRKILRILASTHPHLHIHMAAGHGRSYGRSTLVGLRSLPGIRHCGIWNALENIPNDDPVRALITDIGNDLLYNVSPERTAKWVSETVARLEDRNVNTVLTGLPMQRLERLTPLGFRIVRTILFPCNRLGFAELNARATALHNAVEEFGRERSVQYVRPRGEWYGLDPIHILRRHRNAAWLDYFSRWNDGDEFSRQSENSNRRIPGPLRQFQLKQFERRWIGRKQQTIQPVWSNNDLRISLY